VWDLACPSAQCKIEPTALQSDGRDQCWRRLQGLPRTPARYLLPRRLRQAARGQDLQPFVLYSFADPGFPHIPNNVVVSAEDHFAVEAAAYSLLDHKFGGKLMPKFHGSWIIKYRSRTWSGPSGSP